MSAYHQVNGELFVQHRKPWLTYLILKTSVVWRSVVVDVDVDSSYLLQSRYVNQVQSPPEGNHYTIQ
jgi:hypothetical protein